MPQTLTPRILTKEAKITSGSSMLVLKTKETFTIRGDKCPESQTVVLSQERLVTTETLRI